VRRTAAAFAAAIGLLAGCGRGPAPPSPEAVVRDYLAAERAADGKRLCALYSDRFREQTESDPDNERHLTCARVARLYALRYRGEGHRLRGDVRVDGFRAVATVTCEDPTAADCSLPLVNQDGEWRIDGGLSPND
jgi:hypothetical protein